MYNIFAFLMLYACEALFLVGRGHKWEKVSSAMNLYVHITEDEKPKEIEMISAALLVDEEDTAECAEAV